MPVITVGNNSNLEITRFYDTMKIEGGGMQTWTHTWRKWGETPSFFEVDTGTAAEVKITMTRDNLDTKYSNSAVIVISQLIHDWKIVLLNTNHARYSMDRKDCPTFDIVHSDGEYRYGDYFEDLKITDTKVPVYTQKIVFREDGHVNTKDVYDVVVLKENGRKISGWNYGNNNRSVIITKEVVRGANIEIEAKRVLQECGSRLIPPVVLSVVSKKIIINNIQSDAQFVLGAQRSWADGYPHWHLDYIKGYSSDEYREGLTIK